MANGLNRVILFGNLGRDPELRSVSSGSVLTLNLATTESWYDKASGGRKEQTEWHRVVVWGTRGEALAKILHKGDKVLVEGSLHTSKYDKDGTTHYRTDVKAREVCLCGKSAPREDPPAPTEDDQIPF